MKKNTKNIKSDGLIKTGVIFVLLSILLLSTKINLIKNKNLTNNNNKLSNVQNTQKQNSGDDDIWSKYVNNEFRISFSYPYLLTRKVYKEKGDYEYFVRFEENTFSQGKGVAMGVSKRGVDEEIENIKNSLKNQEDVKISEVEKTEVSGVVFNHLSIVPTGSSLEARDFLVFENNGYTYSLSTVPDQVQKLLESIEITK